MRRSLVVYGAFAGVAFAALASGAMAQAPLAPARNVAVLERVRPGYEAIGLPLGAFTAYPKLILGLGTTDNVYATKTAAKSDTIYRAQPELVLQSNWSRNSLQAYIRGDQRSNANYKKEGSNTYVVGASGEVDAGDSQVFGGANYGRYVEPRTSSITPAGTAKPIKYDMSAVNLRVVHTFNRLRLSGRYDDVDLTYQDSRTTAGAPLSQKLRDVNTQIVAGRGEYALSPDTALFVSAAFNKRNYKLERPAVALDRDSKGTDLAAGARFDLSNFVRGEVQVGYLNQQYQDPSLRTVKGFGANARLEWFPTQLETVTLIGSREVNDATIPGSSGFLSGNYSLQIDHELLRNLILSGRAGIGRDDYEGVSRTDDRLTGYLGANYLMNRRVGITAAYDYLKLTSKGVSQGPSFEVNRFTVSTTLQF